MVEVDNKVQVAGEVRLDPLNVRLPLPVLAKVTEPEVVTELSTVMAVPLSSKAPFPEMARVPVPIAPETRTLLVITELAPSIRVSVPETVVPPL